MPGQEHRFSKLQLSPALTGWAENFTIVCIHIKYAKIQPTMLILTTDQNNYLNFHVVMVATFVGCSCTHWGVSNMKPISKNFLIFTGKNFIKGNPQIPPIYSLLKTTGQLWGGVFIRGYTTPLSSMHWIRKLDQKYRRLIDHSEPASLDRGKYWHYSNQQLTCYFQVILCSPLLFGTIHAFLYVGVKWNNVIQLYHELITIYSIIKWRFTLFL